MADKPVMIFCHKCGNWCGPSTTSDGLKFICTYCKKSVQVIRYPELHPRSAIAAKGGNTRTPNTNDVVMPNSGPTTIAVIPKPRSPQKVIPGRIEGSTIAEAIAPMATGIGGMIAESRERRQASFSEPGPYYAQTPLVNGGNICAECQEGNYKPNGRTYGIAECLVTLPVPNGPITKPLCKEHTRAHLTGFISPRPAKILAIYQPPAPRYGNRQITR